MKAPKVLIVEDEIIVARDLEIRIKRLGFEITGIVSSAKEAVNSVQKVKPDVILMDIYLKGSMTGVEAAKQIWNDYKVPVIYVTAYGDDKTVKNAMETGPIGYILKPIDEKELINALGLALDNK